MTTEVPGAQPWDTPGAFNPAPLKPAKQPRQRKAKPEPAPEPAPAKVRKPRAAKAEKKERVAPETVKISLKEYADLRIAPAAKEFLKIHRIMSGVAGIARAKLLAEINKVFG